MSPFFVHKINTYFPANSLILGYHHGLKKFPSFSQDILYKPIKFKIRLDLRKQFAQNILILTFALRNNEYSFFQLYHFNSG